MVDVVGQNIESHVGGGLDDLGIRELGGAGRLELGIAEFAALHDDVAGEVQNGLGPLVVGDDLARVGDLAVVQARLGAEVGMRVAAIAAVIDLRDDQRNLVPHRCGQNAASERGVEADVRFQRGR